VGERTAQLEAVLMELRAANSELEKEIAERRQAEARIRESEQRLAEAQHLARLGSWHWNMETNVVTWSDQMYRIYGLNPETFTSKYEGFLDHVHPEDRALAQASINRAREEHGSFSYDHRIILPTGEVRTVHAQGEVIANAEGKLIAMSGTGQDITDRKEIEEELRDSREQLRQLSGYLQAAREEERSRISREIHDQFGGALTAIKMDVRQVQRALNEQAPTEETRTKINTRLDSMAELIDSTAKTIRRIAADLRPSVLDDLGLEAAIEWQLQEFQTRSGIHCDLIMEVSDLVLDADGSTALFRVFQEALTNVARHAQATHIDVNLSKEDEFLILEVRDNGKGILPENMIGSHSLGLVGMRERVGLLAGDLNISGKPGEGTTILARIPLNPPKKTGPLPVT
jgi:PAS domain S-box-containing protein